MKVACGRVKTKTDYFAIDTGTYEYQIDFDRCNTVEKIMGWMNHLAEKTWMTKEMLNVFVQLSLERLNYIINYNM